MSRDPHSRALRLTEPRPGQQTISTDDRCPLYRAPQTASNLWPVTRPCYRRMHPQKSPLQMSPLAMCKSFITSLHKLMSLVSPTSQLRDLVICPQEPGILNYVQGRSIVELDLYAPDLVGGSHCFPCAQVAHDALMLLCPRHSPNAPLQTCYSNQTPLRPSNSLPQTGRCWLSADRKLKSISCSTAHPHPRDHNDETTLRPHTAVAARYGITFESFRDPSTTRCC